MKCPLFVMGVLQGGPTRYLKNDDCLKEECAWWDAIDKRCAVVTLAGCLKSLLGWMQELVNKMPHEGQFRK